MYAPAAFHVSDHNKLYELIAAHPLAMLVRNGASGPVIAHVPLAASMVDGKIKKLTGHVAKANPFWTETSGTTVVAAFSGPDAYVSPAYYPSKQEHGKVVPTWNYVRVEARGEISLQSDPAQMRGFIDAPTDHMENSRAAPWSTRDAPDVYIDRLSNAIVGIAIDVTDIQGVWKLSQNKSQADFSGVVDGMEADGNPTIATAMTSLSSRND